MGWAVQPTASRPDSGSYACRAANRWLQQYRQRQLSLLGPCLDSLSSWGMSSLIQQIVMQAGYQSACKGSGALSSLRQACPSIMNMVLAGRHCVVFSSRISVPPLVLCRLCYWAQDPRPALPNAL